MDSFHSLSNKPKPAVLFCYFVASGSKATCHEAQGWKAESCLPPTPASDLHGLALGDSAPWTTADIKPHQGAHLYPGPARQSLGIAQGCFVPRWHGRCLYGFTCAPWRGKLILCKETRKGRESKPPSDLFHKWFSRQTLPRHPGPRPPPCPLLFP